MDGKMRDFLGSNYGLFKDYSAHLTTNLAVISIQQYASANGSPLTESQENNLYNMLASRQATKQSLLVPVSASELFQVDIMGHHFGYIGSHYITQQSRVIANVVLGDDVIGAAQAFLSPEQMKALIALKTRLDAERSMKTKI